MRWTRFGKGVDHAASTDFHSAHTTRSRRPAHIAAAWGWLPRLAVPALIVGLAFAGVATPAFADDQPPATDGTTASAATASADPAAADTASGGAAAGDPGATPPSDPQPSADTAPSADPQPSADPAPAPAPAVPDASAAGDSATAPTPSAEPGTSPSDPPASPRQRYLRPPHPPCRRSRPTGERDEGRRRRLRRHRNAHHRQTDRGCPRQRDRCDSGRLDLHGHQLGPSRRLAEHDDRRHGFRRVHRDHQRLLDEGLRRRGAAERLPARRRRTSSTRCAPGRRAARPTTAASASASLSSRDRTFAASSSTGSSRRASPSPRPATGVGIGRRTRQHHLLHADCHGRGREPAGVADADG